MNQKVSYWKMTLRPCRFFPFCQALLKHYRENERIWWILGSKLDGRPESGTGGIVLLLGTRVWRTVGWAGWRRSWVLYDVAMKAWPSVRNTPTWNEFFLSRAERSEADFIFEATWDGRIPTTWAFQNDFAWIRNKGLTVIPEYNLVRNIGFSDAAPTPYKPLTVAMWTTPMIVHSNWCIQMRSSLTLPAT
ncbi:MAG: hypothetical protein IPN30_06515 [Flavobacteriales bacterium]|nr:hypothetical protein [Flavobacteriales bacterium]